MDTFENAPYSSEHEQSQVGPKTLPNAAETEYGNAERYIQDALDGKKDDLALSVILRTPMSCLNMMFDVSLYDDRERSQRKSQKLLSRKTQRTELPHAINTFGERRDPKQSAKLGYVTREIKASRNHSYSRLNAQKKRRSAGTNIHPVHDQKSVSTEKPSARSIKQPSLEQNSIPDQRQTLNDLIASVNGILIANDSLIDHSGATAPSRIGSSPDRTEILRTSSGVLKDGEEADVVMVERTGASTAKKKRPLSMNEFAQLLESQRTKRRKRRTDDLSSSL